MKDLDARLAKKEAKRRNRDDGRDMGKFEMRPRDPYEILGIKKTNDKEVQGGNDA